MSKRKSAVIGKRGSGTHQPEHQPNARPPGEVQKIISRTKHGKMITKFHDTDESPLPDFSGLRKALGGWLWALAALAVFVVAMCGATVAHGQTHFEFNAKSVYLIIDKNAPKAFGPLPVSAWADTLLIGDAAAPLIRLYNVNWSRMNSGNMYHLAPGVQIRYEAGPGGKTVYVRAGRAVIEAYELTTEKL